MKKLIFITVFKNIHYIKMLSLLIKSIYIYGNIDNNTDILIYTSSYFKYIIENSKFFSDKIKFFCNNRYNSIDLACKARLDLFDYPLINNYNKILYLDTDILIQKKINNIFDLIEKNVIYAVKEGQIDNDPNDYWGGKTLFKYEISNYLDKSSFNSGVMLFNNCIEIKELFNKIRHHISINKSAQFHDQPYIVYNAKKNNLIDNIILNEYVDINIVNSNKIILHFAGGPGIHENKLIHMIRHYKHMLKNTNFVSNNHLNFK